MKRFKREIPIKRSRVERDSSHVHKLDRRTGRRVSPQGHVSRGLKKYPVSEADSDNGFWCIQNKKSPTHFQVRIAARSPNLAHQPLADEHIQCGDETGLQGGFNEGVRQVLSVVLEVKQITSVLNRVLISTVGAAAVFDLLAGFDNFVKVTLIVMASLGFVFLSWVVTSSPRIADDLLHVQCYRGI